jgi:hypothetical protein
MGKFGLGGRMRIRRSGRREVEGGRNEKGDRS